MASNGNTEPWVKIRLAVVVSHPIQYFSPWFMNLAEHPRIDLKVFYLWGFGIENRHDRDFGITVKWDIPLLDGYVHEFVTNLSREPGTHHFRGLDNPELAARIARWQPDALLLFGYAYLTHVRLLLSRRLRSVPVILRGDSHNMGRAPGLKSALARFLRRVLFRRVDAFLAVGQANRGYFVDCAKSPQQVFMAPHFVDNERFSRGASLKRAEALAWRKQLGIPDNAYVFGFVGKFESKKRPLDLLCASQDLSEQHPCKRPVLLFIGNGEQERLLRATAGERIGRDVFFAPFQNQTAMPRAYAALDVLVLPSSFGETWGLCVNEAMNLGVPSIVSDMVGCGPDLIVPGVTGWLFESGNMDDLRRALGDALELSQAAMMAMRDQVRQLVSNYSIEAATKGLVEALDGIL